MSLDATEGIGGRYGFTNIASPVLDQNLPDLYTAFVHKSFC